MAHGRSFAEVDEMTMTEVNLVLDYWRDFPPINEVTAAVYKAGIFSREPTPEETETAAAVKPMDPETLRKLQESMAQNAHLLAR